MSRPANHRLFPNDAKVQDALLLFLHLHGGGSSALMAEDTYEALADFFTLSKETRMVTRDDCNRDERNEAYWHTWVQFSRERLVRTGDMYSLFTYSRGLWRLTEIGKRQAGKLGLRIHSRSCPFGEYRPKVSIQPIMLKSPDEIALMTLADLGL